MSGTKFNQNSTIGSTIGDTHPTPIGELIDIEFDTLNRDEHRVDLTDPGTPIILWLAGITEKTGAITDVIIRLG